MEKLGYYDSAHSLKPTIENLFAHGVVVVLHTTITPTRGRHNTHEE